MDWTRKTKMISHITFRLIRENCRLGYPHFSGKFIKIKVILNFHEPAVLFGGRGFWKYMCVNYIHWSLDLLKTISHYMLLFFVVTQCWSPPWKSSFNPVINEGHSPCQTTSNNVPNMVTFYTTGYFTYMLSTIMQSWDKWSLWKIQM